MVCNRKEKILGISMSSSDWQISRDIKDNLVDNKSHNWGTGFNFTIKGGKVAFNVAGDWAKVFVLSDFCVWGAKWSIDNVLDISSQQKHFLMWICFLSWIIFGEKAAQMKF